MHVGKGGSPYFLAALLYLRNYARSCTLRYANGGSAMRFFTRVLPIFGLGFVAGAAFSYLTSPLFIDREVSEALPESLMVTAVASGMFRDADGVHQGEGMVTVLETATGEHLLRFTEFRVTNGPDLEVWMSSVSDPTASGQVLDGEWLALGQLKGNVGDQTYVIPSGTDLSTFGSVVIWCEQFGVLFSPATLTPSG